jgi:hypothetical protein
VEALRPGLYDQLEEATLNAALATIDSMQPRSELQALLAVQIIATGFAGLRFLRQSHRQMTEESAPAPTDQGRRFANASRAAPTSSPVTTVAIDASGPKAPPLQSALTPSTGRT